MTSYAEPFSHARWIWASGAREDDRRIPATVFAPGIDAFVPTVTRFVRAVELASVQDLHAVLTITADTRYRLFVNGDFVADGPARQGGDYANEQAPDWWFFDTIDLSAALRRGTNIIAVEVVAGPTRQQDHSQGRAGLLAQLTVASAGCPVARVGTDGAWRAATADAYPSGTQSYDARRDDAVWTRSEASSSGWSLAEETGDERAVGDSGLHALHRDVVPAGSLLAPFADQRARIGGDFDGSVRIASGPPVTFWLDFGRIHAAHLLVDAEGSAGTVIHVQPQEIIGREDKNGSAEVITLGSAPLRYRGIELRSARFVKVTLSNIMDEVVLSRVALESVSYLPEPVGSFRSSDAGLDAVVQAAVWTERICAQTIHLDSPVHQEGLGCIGDYLIQSLIDYTVFGDPSLARADVLRTALLLRQKQGVMFHTTYSLLWIEMLRDYWWHTGDTSLLRETADVVALLLDTFEGYRGARGIFDDAPNYMFVDWVFHNGHTLHHPPRYMGQGPLTAFFAGACAAAAEVFDAIGDTDSAGRARRSSDEASTAFRDAFWREEQGLFVDGLLGAPERRVNSRWYPDDPGERESFTAHTNVLAVRNGIVAGDEARRLLKRALGDPALPRMQPYFLHFTFDALDRAGMFDEHASALLRQWQALLAEETGSLKEVWNGFDCDFSHSWSATPAIQVMTRVLGVGVAEPGASAIRLSPSLGELDWAEGVVVTTRGAVEVSWRRTPAQLVGSVRVPAGTRLVTEGAMMRESEDRYRVTIPLAAVDERGH